LNRKKNEIEEKYKNQLFRSSGQEGPKALKFKAKNLGVYKFLKSIEETMQLVVKQRTSSKDSERGKNIDNIFGAIHEIMEKFDPEKPQSPRPDPILQQKDANDLPNGELKMDTQNSEQELRVKEEQILRYEEWLELNQDQIMKLKFEVEDKTQKLADCEKALNFYKEEYDKASNNESQTSTRMSPRSSAPRGFPSISKNKTLQPFEKELQKRNEELKEMQKKVDQYYNFNQLLIKKQEETTGNMNKMVQEYERRIADMSEALKNSELKIEELTEIVRTSQEALIVNSNNNSNTKK